MKYVAVQGCQLDSPFAQITTSPKTSVKCGGKSAYAGLLTIKIDGYTDATVAGGSGSGTLQPTSSHVKIEGEKAVLEGDKAENILVSGTNPSTGAPASTTVTVSIVSAGQTFVKGD